MRTGATRESSWTWGPHRLGAQCAVHSHAEDRKCEIAFQNASMFWLLTNVTPASLKVAETITGIVRPESAKYLEIAK